MHARALAGGVFCLAVVAASLGSDDDPWLSVLALRVTTPAEISSGTLHRAAQEVSMIYGAAGVKPVWLDPTSMPSTRVDAVVVIIVLSGTTAAGQVAELGLRHEDLGYAIRPAQRAYVLWSRIRDVELQF